MLAQQVLNAGLISTEVFQMATSLNQEINAIPIAHDYEAALDTIATSREWVSLRKRAGALVKALGATLMAPDLRSGYVP